ncbi:hypothetical protein FC47_GL001106 [Limosilactobacillus mucosae DSM 13345]|uniref:Uncharacterized protein n=1 Tax=Limosilactobacillus mucosae DSM 13345 TaxID=1423771 RepID=A0A0R1P4Y1_LIMMU|nr:hypothetical protein FC47_GL001106 [Limosilactobacillus mucosae DSM 13345]
MGITLANSPQTTTPVCVFTVCANLQLCLQTKKDHPEPNATVMIFLIDAIS